MQIAVQRTEHKKTCCLKTDCNKGKVIIPHRQWGFCYHLLVLMAGRSTLGLNKGQENKVDCNSQKQKDPLGIVKSITWDPAKEAEKNTVYLIYFLIN